MLSFRDIILFWSTLVFYFFRGDKTGMSTAVCSLLDPSEKVLVVCEKPSVARDLGALLGAGPDAGGFLPFSGGFISWARGHLLELAPPSGYRGDWSRWVWEVLPMVPPDLQFQSVVKKGAAQQLSVLKDLYKKSDAVVNACDAGREGELIWWEILRHCGWGAGLPPGQLGPKKALRFWAQSNTPAGLSEAWSGMRPVSERRGLAEASYARSEADWLLGMNGSRAATLCFPAMEAGGKRAVWSVGRVQTPVLAMIVGRDEEISKFVAKPFYEVKVGFEGPSPFEGTLLVPMGVDPFVPDGEPPKDAKGFLRKEDAQVAVDRVIGSRPSPWEITDTEKPGSENPPGLFSLTELQKWCNQVWGWEAARTLDAAQAAYESAKTLTYPRTDSCFLPDDFPGKMDEVYASIRSGFLDSRLSLPGWVVPPSVSARASFLFDSSKVSDHYAIVPTGVIPSDLNSDAGKVWVAVLRRFMVAFGPAAKTVSVKRRCVWADDVAIATGKRYTDRGWLDVDSVLAPLVGQDPKAEPAGLGPCPSSLPVDAARLHEGKTTPPKHFTEGMLLAAMENIQARLTSDEEEFKEAVAGKGLGTPATRAAIIELLVARSYIQRTKKGGAPSLRATASGQDLIGNLSTANLGFLTLPDMTAEWEATLVRMEKNEAGVSRDSFLSELLGSVQTVVDTLRAKAAASPSSGGTRPRVELDKFCPISGKPVGDMGNFWEFPGFAGRIPKVIAGREFTVDEIADVLSGNPEVFTGFVSKKGKNFDAGLKPNTETGRFDFVFPERLVVDSGEICPVTNKPVEDHGGFWVFPDREGRFWKSVAKRPIAIKEYCELVGSGKTALLDGFISAKGKTFSAHLILKPDGSVGFEFANSGPGGRTPSSPRLTGPGARKKSTGCGEGALKKKKAKKSY